MAASLPTIGYPAGSGPARQRPDIDAAEVLAQPLLWSKLNEAPWAGQIRPENLAEQRALLPTATLTSDPIELDLKVFGRDLVLAGERGPDGQFPGARCTRASSSASSGGRPWRRRTSPRADLPYDRALRVRGS